MFLFNKILIYFNKVLKPNFKKFCIIGLRGESMQKKRKKKKFRIKLVIFIILFSLLGLYIWNQVLPKYALNANSTNSNYSGIGQKAVLGKDGYFSTFTTTDGKIYKEYKQNGDSSWSERYYWDGTMAENGCGITCIATLASRLWYELHSRRFTKKICTN